MDAIENNQPPPLGTFAKIIRTLFAIVSLASAFFLAGFISDYTALPGQVTRVSSAITVGLVFVAASLLKMNIYSCWISYCLKKRF